MTTTIRGTRQMRRRERLFRLPRTHQMRRRERLWGLDLRHPDRPAGAAVLHRSDRHRDRCRVHQLERHQGHLRLHRVRQLRRVPHRQVLLDRGGQHRLHADPDPLLPLLRNPVRHRQPPRHAGQQDLPHPVLPALHLLDRRARGHVEVALQLPVRAGQPDARRDRHPGSRLARRPGLDQDHDRDHDRLEDDRDHLDLRARRR